MLKWFRRGPSPYQTALAMVGPKGSDRVLLASSVQPAVAAEIARVTGLNGQTTIANADSGAKARFEAAAAETGSLLEFREAVPHLPGEDGSADIVVLAPAGTSTDATLTDTLLSEAFRVLRPGGRLIVMDNVGKTGLFAKPAEPPAANDPILTAIVNAGGRAARLLGSADGIHYYEAQKPRG